MRAPSKLCIDLRWIDSSGVGIYIQGIMPGLIQYLTDYDIIGIGNPRKIEAFSWSTASNFQIIPSSADRYSIAEQFSLPFIIPSDTDVFFSPYYTFPIAYRGKLAVTVHDMSHLVVDEIVGNFKKHLYAKMMYRALRRRASLVFTVSQFTKNELVRLTGYPAEKIVPTHLGISEDWYKEPSTPNSRSKPYFVVVGNIKPYKNLYRLVEAFISVQNQIPHDLVIVGQAEGLITGESPEFFQLVKKAGSRIQLTGKVSHDDLLTLVKNAYALVMPSLYEGFGLPPIEAMAAGVPVVVSNAASLPEVCGDSALYFDPYSSSDIANALLRIAKDSDLHSKLAKSSPLWASRYQWSICSQKTAAALVSCMTP